MTSEYAVSVEEALGRFIVMADQVIPGLERVDALAAAQFIELRVRASAAKATVHRAADGDLDMKEADIKTINAMEDAMGLLNDLCASQD